ncbi:hypothetical protein CHS0354_008892 [Potamilus streckersoni]|uniref:Mitochondrial import inner membrane translocase subunit TIM50 n=1 Tax=Potamilus streckersoni TaxID=2493646 RepID=A0AAE0SYW4_9BIVA|nr:hypothetical protein CHS0354_008892 [Potamilus streckersoni]
MAAHMSYMCVTGRCRQMKGFPLFRKLYSIYSRKLSLKTPIIIKKFVYIPHKPCIYFLTTDNVPRLTDEILDAKLGQIPPEKDSSGGDQKTDSSQDEHKKGKKESKWSGKNAWKFGLGFLGAYFVCFTGVVIWQCGAPELDPAGNEVQDEYSDLPAVMAYSKRAWRWAVQQKKSIQDPSRDKLLPDPLKYPYVQPPYTLVMEMTGVLVHPDWTYSTGWRFKKRPGVTRFLQQVSPPLFEIVIFTSEQGFTADPIVNGIDPHGYIMYRLYRDATRYMNNHHVKDLSCLNRDLSKVIFLDWDQNSFQLQKENTLKLKRWKGNDDDRALEDVANFLQTLAASGVEDVRPVLKYYGEFDDPLEKFKENQQKLREQQEMQARMLQEKEQQSKIKSLGPSWFRR